MHVVVVGGSIPEKVGGISRVSGRAESRGRDRRAGEDVGTSSSVCEAREREVVITSRTAALAVCLPGQTFWCKSVGHEICSCQVSIADLDVVSLPRQQANVTGCF